jgi:hypothetical protein
LPFGSGRPAASTPAIISRIFFSTAAYGTTLRAEPLVAVRRSSTQPLMFTMPVRNVGEVGSHACLMMASSPSR